MEDQAGERREWTVSGMDCGSCAIKVRGAVERLPGVSQVNIATMTERLSLTLDPIQTPPEKVEAAVKSLGYGIAPRGTVKERKPLFCHQVPQERPKLVHPISRPIPSTSGSVICQRTARTIPLSGSSPGGAGPRVSLSS